MVAKNEFIATFFTFLFGDEAILSCDASPLFEAYLQRFKTVFKLVITGRNTKALTYSCSLNAWLPQPMQFLWLKEVSMIEERL